MKLVCTLSACADCVAFVANGDVPEGRPDFAEEMHDNLQLAPGQHLVNADTCDEDGEPMKDHDGKPVDFDGPDGDGWREDWFSWSPCECCGSRLGGMRNRLAILEEEPAAEPAPHSLAYWRQLRDEIEDSLDRDPDPINSEYRRAALGMLNARIARMILGTAPA